MIGVDVLQRFRLEINERNRVHVVVAVVAFLFAAGFLAHAVLQDDRAGAEEQRGESFKKRVVVSAKGGYEL
jgi:hypothetical protein